MINFKFYSVELPTSDPNQLPIGVQGCTALFDPLDTKLTRIYGGHKTDMNSWQWFARLEIDGKQFKKGQISCGSTIIRNRWLLTAAHCLKYGSNDSQIVSVDQLEIIINLYDKTQRDTSKIIKAKKIIIHELFDGNTTEFGWQSHDIALIEVKEDLYSKDLYQSGIRTAPACLPPKTNPTG